MSEWFFILAVVGGAAIVAFVLWGAAVLYLDWKDRLLAKASARLNGLDERLSSLEGRVKKIAPGSVWWTLGIQDRAASEQSVKDLAFRLGNLEKPKDVRKKGGK